MARSELAMSAAAALILVAAASWLAFPRGSAAETGSPPPSEDPGVSVRVEGIVIRDETAIAEPESEYAVLAPGGERVAAGTPLLACSDSREGLVQAVRDAGRDGGALTRAALREATRAASAGDGDGGFLLPALYAADTHAGYTLVTAPESAIWLTETDGYEHFTPAALENIGVSALRELMDAEPEGIPAAGKLVFSNVWRFAALLSASVPLQSGDGAELDFGAFTVTADVEYVSESYGGERAVVFVTDEAPSAAAALRRARAQLRC